VASLRVADRGLREGILHGLMGRTLEQALSPAPAREPEDGASGGVLGGSRI
jgi:hypothetical protein